MGWIISPSQGVVNNNDGSFILPCSNTDIVYNITYVNNGCSSNTVTYRYKSSGNCGTCTDFMGNLSIIGDTLPATSASSQLLGYATKTIDYTSYTFESSNKSMIDYIDLGTTIAPNVYAITGTVYENTESYGRSSTISVIAKGPNTPSSGCPDSFTVGQDAGGGGGSCPVSGSIISRQVVDAAGSHSAPIMRVLKNSTYTGYSFSSSDTSKINPSSSLTPTIDDWYLVMANVAANTGDLKRTIPVTVKMSGTTTPSSGCNYTVNVEQKGVCDTIYENYYIGAWSNGYTVPGSGSTSEAIAYVSHVSPYKSFAESGWTVELVGTYSFVSNPRVTNETGGPGGSKRVVVNISANNTSSNRTFSVKFTGHKTDGYDCERTIEFTQTPATQTCTCDDLVFNGTSSHATVTFINNSSNFASVTVGNVGFTIFDESSVSHPFTVNFGNISLSPGQSKSLKVDIDGAQGTVLGVTAVLDGVSDVFVKSKTQRTDRWITDNTNDDGTMEYGNTITLTHFEPNS